MWIETTSCKDINMIHKNNKEFYISICLIIWKALQFLTVFASSLIVSIIVDRSIIHGDNIAFTDHLLLYLSNMNQNIGPSKSYMVI